MDQKIFYFCNNCNQDVDPIKKNKGIFFKKTDYFCPTCGSSVEKLENLEKLKNDNQDFKTDIENSVPSLSTFIKYYKKGDYLKAIYGDNPPSNPSLKDIDEAIDLFQMEHLETFEEWGEQLEVIKRELLESPNSNLDGQIVQKKEKTFDPEKREKAVNIYLNAINLYNRRRLPEAIEMFTQAIEIDPTFAAAYQQRSYSYLLLPDYENYLDNVIEDCSKVIELEPDNAGAYNDRGRAYIRKGNCEKAIMDYRQTLELNASFQVTIMNLMSAQILCNQYDDAVGTYGAWRNNIYSQEYILIGASVVCIALALEGNDYSQFQEPLLDKNYSFEYLHHWNPASIDNHLNKLEKENYYPDRVKEARKIQDLFKEHMIS